VCIFNTEEKGMQRKKILAFTICFVMAMSMALALRQTYAAGPEIYVDPVSTEAVLNNDYTVYIKVKDTNDLYGWEFQLDYDETKLELTYADIVTGTLNTPTNTFQSVTDAGHLWWAVSTLYNGNNTNGVNVVDAAIFKIEFHTIDTGNSALDLSGTILSDSTATAIVHTTTDGDIDIYGRDLTVTSITILDLGCKIYANDIDENGTLYYYPVEVVVDNAGTLDAGAFDVKLQVYYDTTPGLETETEIAVTSLAAGTSTTVNFTATFRPLNTNTYHLTATVDSQSEVSEDDETNNSLDKNGITVTIIGDINGDRTINILDAVIMSKAWDAFPTDGWWNIKADINHNGEVSIADGTRLGIHWGESW
jgi:hypothetical protein